MKDAVITLFASHDTFYHDDLLFAGDEVPELPKTRSGGARSGANELETEGIINIEQHVFYRRARV